MGQVPSMVANAPYMFHPLIDAAAAEYGVSGEGIAVPGTPTAAAATTASANEKTPEPAPPARAQPAAPCFAGQTASSKAKRRPKKGKRAAAAAATAAAATTAAPAAVGTDTDASVDGDARKPARPAEAKTAEAEPAPAAPEPTVSRGALIVDAAWALKRLRNPLAIARAEVVMGFGTAITAEVKRIDTAAALQAVQWLDTYVILERKDNGEEAVGPKAIAQLKRLKVKVFRTKPGEAVGVFIAELLGRIASREMFVNANAMPKGQRIDIAIATEADVSDAIRAVQDRTRDTAHPAAVWIVGVEGQRLNVPYALLHATTGRLVFVPAGNALPAAAAAAGGPIGAGGGAGGGGGAAPLNPKPRAAAKTVAGKPSATTAAPAAAAPAAANHRGAAKPPAKPAAAKASAAVTPAKPNGDWACPWCGSQNAQRLDACGNCTFEWKTQPQRLPVKAVPAAATAAAAAVAVVGRDQWQCARCTQVNHIAVPECEGCGSKHQTVTVNHADRKHADRKHVDSDNDNSDDGGDDGGDDDGDDDEGDVNGAAPPQWACGRCTSLNYADLLNCEFCATPKPR